MPDPVTHYIFGRQVTSELPEEIRKLIELPVFDRALQGPDPWSTIGFYGGKHKQYARRSGIMHKSDTGLFLTALARQVKQDLSVPTFSVLAGMICHYCLDKQAHPYIICKGGMYDGTAQTRAQSGGHVRLERAIDSYYIRHTYGKAPWHFSIPAQILSLRQYPESLRQPLDRVYRQVYGWEKVFDQINMSLRDERWFYGLMQDPFGIVHTLLRPVSGGKTNYCIYSFYHREIDGSKVDYMNLGHEPWRHPYDPSVVSRDSFFDLFEKAKQEALEMIRRICCWIYLDEPSPPECLFGNSNYSTGLDCDDPRNSAKPACEPLKFE